MYKYNWKDDFMGDFYEIAERILSRLEDSREGIHANEIPPLAKTVFGTDINCYPGALGYGCHELALFVSLNSPLYAKKGRGHLKCGEAMEKIVQHMQGSCLGKTKKAIFITDSWDVSAFAKWKSNLEQISSSNHFEIYLLVGRSIAHIKI